MRLKKRAVEEQQERASIAGCRLLLVEDNELNVEIAEMLLEDQEIAGNGEDMRGMEH